MGKEGVAFSRRRLSSWKEIAAYIGRDERTVKRWESSRGLPVRRVPGAGHAAVFAYADEVEAWLRGEAGAAETTGSAEAAAPGPRWRRAIGTGPVLLASAALVAAAFGYVVWHSLPRSIAEAHTNDPVAAELYRSGLHAWQTRTPTGLARAIKDFDGAVARDPHFAAAFAGLADSYNLEGEFTGAPRGGDYSRAAAAARRAIVLDPSLAGAHAALAFSEFYGARDLPDAEKEFRRAVVLDPQSAVVHHWYATFLMTIGNFGLALSEIGKAENLDAESTAIPADRALILFHAGRTAEAIRLLKQLEDDNPAFASPHGYLATIALSDGDDATLVRELKAAAVARQNPVEEAVAGAATQGLAKGGHRAMLQAMYGVRRRFFASHQVAAYTLAVNCAELGDDACAKSYLSLSVARHETETIALLIDPPFARFHKAAWFPPLLAEAGFAGNVSGGRRDVQRL